MRYPKYPKETEGRNPPDPLAKPPQPVDKPSSVVSKPGLKGGDKNAELVAWHNMPYAQRLELLRTGKAPAFIAVSSVASRLKYLARLIAMQEQGTLPGKNQQPGIQEKKPAPVAPTPAAPAPKAKASIQQQAPPWVTRMLGSR